MRYAFAGDRDISVAVLDFLIQNGHFPVALLVTEKGKESHADELIVLSKLDNRFIFQGYEFREQKSKGLLEELALDYIISIHFPYFIPGSVLRIPKVGFINLHPAYLPYNKGWHTPSWGIIENTIYGATLHFMSDEVDAGDIINQKQCEVLPEDTAHSLYQRVKSIELNLFKESLSFLTSLNPPRDKQTISGTAHLKKDLSLVQPLNLEDTIKVRDILNKLRALTTNRVEEAAYFIADDKKYFVQVIISEDINSGKGS